MSLNFDHSKVEDKSFIWVPAEDLYGPVDCPKHLMGQQVMNPRFEAVIWATLSVDIGEITAQNYEEFFKRYLLIRLASGHETYLTLADIQKSIGLHTNVSKTTYAAFKKKLIAVMERDVEWRLGQAIRELKDVTNETVQEL